MLAAFGEQHVIAFFLVLARITPLFLLAPLFSSRMFPARARGVAAVAIAAGLAPVVARGSLLPVDVLGVAGLVAKELMIGAIFAYILAALFAALQTAGNFIDFMIGFTFGGSVDPINGQNSSVMTSLYGMMATVVFVTIGGDAWVLSGLAHSYDVVAIDQLPSLGRSLEGALSAFSGMFTSAVQVGGPVMLALILTDAAFGVISRVMPQINVFQVGFPAKVLIGIVLVAATMPFVVGWLGDRLQDDVSLALRALRAG